MLERKDAGNMDRDKVLLFSPVSDGDRSQEEDTESVQSGDSNSTNSSRPTSGASLRGPFSAKSKKRVSFPTNEEHLVKILEIPSRDDSPMIEELEPYDPQKLELELDQMRLEVYSGKYDVSQAVSAQLSGLAGLNSNFSKSLVKQATRSLRKDSTPNKQNQLSTPVKPKKTATMKNLTVDDFGTQLRVGSSVFKEKKAKENAPNRPLNTSTGRRQINILHPKKERHTPHEKHKDGKTFHLGKDARKTLRSAAGTASPTPTNSLHGISHGNNSKHKERNQQDSKHCVGSSGDVVKPSADPDSTSLLLPRIIHSPYRHGSASSVRSSGSASGCSVETISLSETDYRLGSGSTRSTGIFGASTKSYSPRTAAQKYYAWQMANGLALQKLETPCISQLWDVPKQSDHVKANS